MFHAELVRQRLSAYSLRQSRQGASRSASRQSGARQIAAWVGLLLLGGLALDGCSRTRVSQPAQVEQAIGQTRVTIRYNRPSARGRELFGGIIKFGEVWDPGADEATTIQFSRDVSFAGRPVSAGKYSVWAIPTDSLWTLILSTASRVEHTPYPEGKDALRVDIAPKAAPYMETLGFYFPQADSTRAMLVLHWGATMIELPIVPR